MHAKSNSQDRQENKEYIKKNRPTHHETLLQINHLFLHIV